MLAIVLFTTLGFQRVVPSTFALIIFYLCYNARISFISISMFVVGFKIGKVKDRTIYCLMQPFTCHITIKTCTGIKKNSK